MRILSRRCDAIAGRIGLVDSSPEEVFFGIMLICA
jgi:hypothetical protein